MNYITEEIKFKVPQNGGFKYRFYECADQIADLLDMYFDTQIEDISRITDLIDDEIKVAQDRQFKENQLDQINEVNNETYNSNTQRQRLPTTR